MILTNEYFPDLGPLTDYLNTLEEVTESPSEPAIERLVATDKVLTDRAVLFPYQKFVHREGLRTFGHEPCTVSSMPATLARLALHEPGSPEYVAEYKKEYSRTGEVRLDAATPESRRNSARVALIGLGGKLAVSGAFVGHQVQPAYEAISASLQTIGKDGSEADFAAFGLRRIGLDLMRQYDYIQRGHVQRNPIGKYEAQENIRAAWNAVGWPYGWLTRPSIFFGTYSR